MKSINGAKKVHGFSLIELAVVVIIMGMMMTMGVKMASSFQDRSAMSLTRSKQLAVREALRAYLATNGRLPCPASGAAATGLENPTPANGTCDTPTGIIPFQTLQLPRDSVIDGWDRFFTYEVWWDQTPATVAAYCPAGMLNSSNFTLPSSLNNILTYHDGDAGCINIQDPTVGLPRYVAAVIISHGANGFGGFSSKGAQVDYSAVGNANPEKDNIVGHANKTLHTFHTEPFSDNFDDIVLEISPDDLVAPLKRDGTIVSINQLARDRLMGIKSTLVTNCNLTLPANHIAILVTTGLPPPPGPTGTPLVITYSMVAPKFNINTTINATEYKDVGGIPCTTITVP